MKTNKKLSRSVYSERCANACALVSDLCSRFDRYACAMLFDKVLKSYSLAIRANGSGIVTLSFFSSLAETLDKTNLLYDFFISPKDGYCTFYVDLMPYER